MRKKRKSQVRLFSILSTFLMIFSLITPGFVSAKSTGKPYTSLNPSSLSAEEKLTNNLLEQFDEKDQVRILVKFTDKADLKSATEKALSMANKHNFTPYQKVLTQRSAVISELKTTALTSQSRVLDFLQAEAEKGNASDIKPYHIVNMVAVTTTKEVAEKLAYYTEVDKIAPNEFRLYHSSGSAEGSTVDTAVGQFEITGDNNLQSIEWNIDRINAPQVWSLGFDGEGIIVANMDTGVQWDHPTLKDKYLGYDPETDQVDHTYSFYDPVYNETVAYDLDGHGTHVMGTMVGGGADGSNQIGVAPGAKWIAVQAFTQSILGLGAYDEDLIAGAEWLLAPGGDITKTPAVVNNSWGGGAGIDEFFMDAVDSWRAAGIVPVFAAGNVTSSNPGGPGSVSSPGNYPQSFSVGNTNRDDMVSAGSLRGPSPYGEIKPDVSAPGSGIRSAFPGDSFATASGTSMAAPHVAGLVALLRQAGSFQGDLEEQVNQIEQVIKETARERTDAEYPESPNNGYGWGIIDAFAAVASVASNIGQIKGTVTKDEIDTEPATYEHTPPSESYSGYDLPMTIFVSDNVSVTSVELHYGETIINAHQVSGDFRSGEFAVTVPGDDLEPGDFTYTWVINDYGNNILTTEEFTVTIKPGISVGYFEDFDAGQPIGWTISGTNSTWEWGAPSNVGPESAYSGENVYSTNLSGEYISNMNATLIMPPIDAPDSGDFYLQFMSWHHFEYSTSSGRAWDYGQVVVSTDLENWTVLRPFERERKEWAKYEVDLSAYLGERIYIGFYTFSDGSVQREGWYIDDVTLTDESMYSNDPVPPTFDHEAPEDHFKGLDLALTVEVFDDLQVGGATLHFQDESGQWHEIRGDEIDFDFDFGLFGTYQAIVPGSYLSGDTFSYKWVVYDRGGNEVESDVYEVPLLDPISIGYFNDFEDGAEGWKFMSNFEVPAWELGTPTSGPGEAYSGDNVFATKLHENYPNSMREYLIMPIVNLPEGDAYLEFQSWHQFEYSTISGTEWDYGQILVSTDLTNWEVLTQLGKEAMEWNLLTVDLSDYAGQTVAIAFYAYSDSSVNRIGWFIDDVSLTDTPSGEPINAVGSENIYHKQEEKVNSYFTTDEEEDKFIPLSATITVKESGMSTNTDPRNGSYSLFHEEGSYTVVAESYGYYPHEEEIEVVENEVTELDFVLDELPIYNVKGIVTDKLTGRVVPNATIMLVNDANVEPVRANGFGVYHLSAYEGDYIVRIIGQGYEVLEVPLSLFKNQTFNIKLDPFFPVGGEVIGYDDGTVENARAWNYDGFGWAVKMSLAEGQNLAQVTAGVFQFYSTEWPTPGDTPFAVEVWSAGEDGMPDQKLAGPIEAEAVRNLNEWTVVDLTEHNIIVNGDFFMVYMQTGEYPYVPGLAIDESSDPTGRSYEFIEGSWGQAPLEEGNYMIRSIVAYGVEHSVITSPSDGHFTNEPTITIEGNASEGTAVEVYNNDVAVGMVEVDENRTFTFDVPLTEGDNVIGTRTYIDGELAKIDETITVILDTAAPNLSVFNPVEDDKFNQETIFVEGLAEDEYLSHVTINDRTAVLTDGAFSERVMLDEGENVITISAYDLAGNVTTEVFTVTADFTAPTIENVTPTEDVHVAFGDTVTVEFESEEGLEATFSVLLPITQSSERTETSFEMTETEPGKYVGTFTASEAGYAKGAVIEVRAKDAYGNMAIERAEGKLFIDPSTDRINGPDRYETAVEISKAGWDSADTVVIARGDDYADALTGVPLANYLDAPMLLTRSNELVDVTFAEIERLGATNVIILGGVKAVSASVEQQLVDAGFEVERIYGSDRYETAAEIAKRIAPQGTDKAVIVNGSNFVDALSVAPYAASENMPILLTRSDTLNNATETALQKLGVKETFVIGGKAAVSEEVMSSLTNPTRLGGATRYDTNIAVVEEFGEAVGEMFVATDATFADALTGAVLAAKNNSGLLLVRDNVPTAVASFIEESLLLKLTLFGGETAISAEVENQLFDLLK